MVLPISPLPPELAAALAPDETAAAFMRRCGGGPVPTGLPFAPSLRPGDAMELVGASGSGKTELLVQVRRGGGQSCAGDGGEAAPRPPSSSPQAAADALLPAPLGRGERVVYIDCDGTLDGERVRDALLARATAAGASARGAAAAAAAGLAGLAVVQCHSTLDLLATLTVLKPLLEGGGGGADGDAAPPPPPPPCRLLLLDNAAAFYWADRTTTAAASLASRCRGEGGGRGALGLAPASAAAATRLRAALRGHRAAAIVATHAVLPPRPGEGGVGGTGLPRGWPPTARRGGYDLEAGSGPAGERWVRASPREGEGGGVVLEVGAGGLRAVGED